MNGALQAVLSRSGSTRIRFGGTLLLASTLHIGVGLAAGSMPRPDEPQKIREMEIQALPEQEPPPPPTPPIPPPEAPEPEKLVRPSPAPRARVAPAAPPAAAAKVLTAPDDAPADLTGGMVIGSAETFAGGATSATSTGTRAGVSTGVQDPYAKVTSPSSAPPRPDLSRPPRLAEGVSWNCPFPAEADERGVDDAVVGLSIEVAKNGDVMNVTIDRDPGTGFGPVAAACARSKRFSPAEDRDGKPIAGRSRVNVRFHR